MYNFIYQLFLNEAGGNQFLFKFDQLIMIMELILRFIMGAKTYIHGTQGSNCE